MSEDIKSKLLKSDSVASFSSEQRIFDLLKENNWEAVHGGFYVDQTTKKFREIDVLGRQFWSFDEEIPTSIDLNLVIEAKTAKDYHLIFSTSAEDKRSRAFLCNKDWIGLLHYDDKRLKEFLKEHITLREIESLLRTFRRLSFPDEIQIVSNLYVEPNPAPLKASAFRETNSKVEKELDNSVFWKAFQSVNNAIESLKVRSYEGLISDLLTSIEVAKEDGNLISNSILELMSNDLNRIKIYHPIIVIDSRIWSYSETTLIEKKWIRFNQLDTGGHADFWVDVVNSTYFAQYISNLTNHYKKRITKLKGKLR